MLITYKCPVGGCLSKGKKGKKKTPPVYIQGPVAQCQEGIRSGAVPCSCYATSLFDDDLAGPLQLFIDLLRSFQSRKLLQENSKLNSLLNLQNVQLACFFFFKRKLNSLFKFYFRNVHSWSVFLAVCLRTNKLHYYISLEGCKK